MQCKYTAFSSFVLIEGLENIADRMYYANILCNCLHKISRSVSSCPSCVGSTKYITFYVLKMGIS